MLSSQSLTICLPSPWPRSVFFSECSFYFSIFQRFRSLPPFSMVVPRFSLVPSAFSFLFPVFVHVVDSFFPSFPPFLSSMFISFSHVFLPFPSFFKYSVMFFPFSAFLLHFHRVSFFPRFPALSFIFSRCSFICFPHLSFLSIFHLCSMLCPVFFHCLLHFFMRFPSFFFLCSMDPGG